MQSIKMKSQIKLLTAIAIVFLFAGCQSIDLAIPADKSKSTGQAGQLTFIDIGRFDNDLQKALTSQEKEIKVSFYDKISPNNTPERLQKWLSAVEKGGGVVQIEPPPGELVARDPLSVVQLLGGLWNALQTGLELNQSKLFDSTRGHDAVISLERNAKGEAVISKISFKKKANSNTN